MKPYSREERENILEQCIKGLDSTKPTKTSCEKIDSCGEKCRVYAKPKVMWRNGQVCPMATHYSVLVDEPKEKVRVGQQKQKKNKK